MNNKIIIAVIIVAIVVLGGYFLLKDQQSSPTNLNLQTIPSQETSQPQEPEESQKIQEPQDSQEPQKPLSEPSSSVEQNIVIYSNSGYSPNILRVKVGTTITFKNESSKSMWTASAVHPSHTVYSGTPLEEHCPDNAGTAFDACTGIQPGNSWNFTFTKPGNWKYHNHLAPSHTGTIIVE